MNVFPRLLGMARVALAGIALGLGAGCTSIDRTVAPDRDPAALREVFVVSNFNDNHALARRIAAAFRARGIRAESGPQTLLPATAEAVVNYQDNWAWDFGDHLVHLRITLADPGEIRPYATATRRRNIARATNLEEVIPELVAELVAPVAKK